MDHTHRDNSYLNLYLSLMFCKRIHWIINLSTLYYNFQGISSIHIKLLKSFFTISRSYFYQHVPNCIVLLDNASSIIIVTIIITITFKPSQDTSTAASSPPWPSRWSAWSSWLRRSQCWHPCQDPTVRLTSTCLTGVLTLCLTSTSTMNMSTSSVIRRSRKFFFCTWNIVCCSSVTQKSTISGTDYLRRSGKSSLLIHQPLNSRLIDYRVFKDNNCI